MLPAKPGWDWLGLIVVEQVETLAFVDRADGGRFEGFARRGGEEEFIIIAGGGGGEGG